jgi:hypothetical protein
MQCNLQLTHQFLCTYSKNCVNSKPFIHMHNTICVCNIIITLHSPVSSSTVHNSTFPILSYYLFVFITLITAKDTLLYSLSMFHLQYLNITAFYKVHVNMVAASFQLSSLTSTTAWPNRWFKCIKKTSRLQHFKKIM